MVAMIAPQSMIMRSLLVLSAPAGGAGRPRRRQVPHRHRPVAPRACTTPSSASPTRALFAAQYADPYVQSHPMPSERIAALEGIAKGSPYWDKKDPAELQLRHDLMRAKLSGFLDRPDTIARRYPTSDQSLPARYARAISAYRHKRYAQRHRADRRSDPEPAAATPISTSSRARPCSRPAAGAKRSRRCAARWRSRPIRP